MDNSYRNGFTPPQLGMWHICPKEDGSRVEDLKFKTRTVGTVADFNWIYGSIEDKPKRKGIKMFGKKKEIETKTIVCKIEDLRYATEAKTNYLEERIHALEYPMGKCWESHWSNGGSFYVFANKQYVIDCGYREKVIAFRKKGDYVEFKYEEITVLMNQAMTATEDSKRRVWTETYLLKDELIPLDATVDFGDIEFIEV